VLETKNMNGWIFGSENQAQWTQKIYERFRLSLFALDFLCEANMRSEVETAGSNNKSLPPLHGKRAAAPYSLIGMAMLNDPDPEAYLLAVPVRIAEHLVNGIEALLPWNLACHITR